MTTSADPPDRGNLFALPTSPPKGPEGEVFEVLLTREGLRLERIVSTGQATPPGEWYDQEADEWVVLLSGAATLRFDDSDETIDLVPGDWLLIPARRRHRVERTAADVPTIWLALHVRR